MLKIRIMKTNTNIRRTKTFFFAAVLSLGFLFGSQAADAQHFYVSVQPAVPVYVHPACPSHRHVWVESEWVWMNGGYVHHPGYWAIPPRGFHVWIAGSWIHERRGFYWVGGHWA